MKGISIAAAAGLLAAWAAPPALVAGTVTVTDVAGRQVEVGAPVESLVLGEGRLVYGVAVLDTEDPFGRVVGWRDDLKKADPATYASYRERYPSIEALPSFGGVKEGTFDIEQAIALDPDVVVMNLEAMGATEDAGLDDKLAAAGIPLVYIDFREAPMRNTETSMRILGTLLGKEARAEAFIDFRAEQIALVTDRLAKAGPEKPLVFLERAAGFSDECCMSFGSGNFGRMVEMAGGVNMAAGIIPGTFGTVNPEQVVASDPEQVIVTGADWEAYAPGGGWVGLGPGADRELARHKLGKLMERPAYAGVRAVRDNQVHAVWHQFYNSPYQFVVIQEMARWLHPGLFAELDPQAAFRTLHERFLPVDYQPGYFVSLRHDD